MASICPTHGCQMAEIVLEYKVPAHPGSKRRIWECLLCSPKVRWTHDPAFGMMQIDNDEGKAVI